MIYCMLGLILLQATSQPATLPSGADPKLWARMEQINDRGAKIKFLTADFSQEKFTPLLKKPLLSSGKINVSGPLMRWDTNKPEPTVMRIGEKEVELYYPKRKVMEIYPVDERLGSLAASPLPRLDVLKRFFRFEEITGESSSEKLALKLAPIDESLAKHIDSVQVLLDVQQGYILRAEMLDADGDRTVITFSNISTGTRPPDDSLKIELPPDVKITRPLEGLHGQQPSSQPH